MNKISFEKYIEIQATILANYDYDTYVHGLKCRENLSPNEAKELADMLLMENKCEVEYRNENKTE
jgi:hypothetical protein